ncbi:MAG TPA: hypothetical protein VKV40_01355 [Ktedonobacteraceae bacterium]|nr:hypothetical protein [Ktedonobacteraceae bacterium]
MFRWSAIRGQLAQWKLLAHHGWAATQAIIRVLALLMLVAANLCTHSSVALAVTRIHQAGGTVTSSPASGPTQATIAVSGSGWQNVADGTVVNFGFSTVSFCTATSYTPATTGQAGVVNGGAFSGWFLWPARTPVGAYTVCASLGAKFLVAGSYTVLSAKPPQLTISSPTFNVGQQATVTGSNFLPAQTGITLAEQQLSGGSSTSLGTVTSGANGAFSQTLTIPANPTGPVELIASAGSSTPPTLSASVTFIVYTAPVTPTPAPTTTPSPSPTPSPTPGITATPTQGTTVTPTASAPQQTPVIPTPTATPTSFGTQPQAPTPTGSAKSARQSVTQMPTTGSRQSGGKQAPALIAGAIFVMLASALVVLILRRKGRKGTTQTTPPLSPAVTGTSSLNPVPSWDMTQATQAAQPPPGWAPGFGWGDMPVQQVSPSLSVMNSNLNAELASTFHTYQAGETPEVPAINAISESGVPPSAPIATASQNDDLLQDSLLVAIIQQARSGLFVLPGKKL